MLLNMVIFFSKKNELMHVLEKKIVVLLNTKYNE